jgi:hypothetical protein
MPINADGFFPTPDSLWRELLCWVPWWGGVVAPGKLQTLISEWPMYSVYIYIHVYPILRDTQNRGPRIFKAGSLKKGVLWWLFFAVARNTLWIAAESWLATRIQNFGSSFLVLLDATMTWLPTD